METCVTWIVDFLANFYRSCLLDLGSEDLKERGDYSLMPQTILFQFQCIFIQERKKESYDPRKVV